MTSYNGLRVLKPPCCDKLFLIPNARSINLSANEYWTDGTRLGSLSSNDEGLRRCSCGTYFLLLHADVCSELELPEAPPYNPKRKFRVPFFWRWLGQPDYDTLEAQAQEDYERLYAQAIKGYYEVDRVTPDELPSVINTPNKHEEVILSTRRLYWRHLNGPYRHAYREHRETEPEIFAPPYTPSEMQVENMVQMVRILEQDPEKNTLELSELYRELGDMDKATSYLDAYKGQTTNHILCLRQCLDEGRNGPTRYRVWCDV